jgi:hypothetical protein
VVQKLVLRNEVVKVKGRVKVITVKKEDFYKILKLTKLRILDKEYEALMPPLDVLQKNTIDINGLATLVQQYMIAMFQNKGSTTQSSPAQMVLTTQSGTITFSYAGNVMVNSQGVTIYIQVLQQSGNWTFQYYYIGFDTTNDSYSTSQVDLYVSAYINGPKPSSNQTVTYYTDAIRIAYADISFTKTSDSYLFIVWLIEFQNLPPYLIFFTPILQNNAGIQPYNGYVNISNATFALLFYYNGNCNLSCSGNCPSTGIFNFIIYIQNNSVILEIPSIIPLNAGVTSLELLFCSQVHFNNLPVISGSVSSTLTPPVSGATFYVAITTVTVTYQGS